ncbi:Hypothetical predicted protein [Octopus vulgaris]|uniref:Uncharacterized protein n=1 Tax=Octopus vulgaris TaxID=6645 RepID=A0AA36EXZ8_OCTVU|nr:Hypothetical predicted protein [Octopus vulgaris]
MLALEKNVSFISFLSFFFLTPNVFRFEPFTSMCACVSVLAASNKMPYCFSDSIHWLIFSLFTLFLSSACPLHTLYFCTVTIANFVSDSVEPNYNSIVYLLRML